MPCHSDNYFRRDKDYYVKGYCVKTFPMRYTILFGAVNPRIGINNGSDFNASCAWSHIFELSVKKNGRGSKCCKK